MRKWQAYVFDNTEDGQRYFSLAFNRTDAKLDIYRSVGIYGSHTQHEFFKQLSFVGTESEDAAYRLEEMGLMIEA